MKVLATDKPLTRNCPGCPHLVAGRAAERTSAVVGKRAEYFCLVRPEIQALSLALAMNLSRPLRACHLNHRPESAGLTTLRQLETASGLAPLKASREVGPSTLGGADP